MQCKKLELEDIQVDANPKTEKSQGRIRADVQQGFAPKKSWLPIGNWPADAEFSERTQIIVGYAHARA